VQLLSRSVELAPNEGFSKYMNLGQLLEAEEAVQCFETGIKHMLAHRATLTDVRLLGSLAAAEKQPGADSACCRCVSGAGE
jgi:hypothetical protein